MGRAGKGRTELCLANLANVVTRTCGGYESEVSIGRGKQGQEALSG